MAAYTPPRLLRTLFLIALISVPGYANDEQPSISIDDKPLQIDGRVPTAGALTRSAETIPSDVLDIEMLKPLIGVIGTLEPRELVSINRLARPTDDNVHAEPIAYLHFSRGQKEGTLSIHSFDDEHWLLLSVDDQQRRWTLRREVFDRLGITFAAARSADRFAETNEAMAIELPTPHTQSPIVLDPKTVRSRIRISLPRLERELSTETFRVRLPRDYNPQSPVGVLIWISPTPDGRIHSIFEPICDELGLIAVGVDNNGNKRPITDRLQNHLDSIETLAEHAILDRERIYLTGMSGGGRCSGILQLCFPELFAGAVPVVGLDTYHNAPTGTPGQYWPKRLGKPNGPTMKMLKERRIRSITGSADFNEPEMTLRTKLLQDDGIDAQIDIIEGMAHTMPNDDQFGSALRWVDEPRRDAIAQARLEAKRILDETQDQDESIPAVRLRLIEVMELLPNSDWAWQAAARLGYKRP